MKKSIALFVAFIVASIPTLALTNKDPVDPAALIVNQCERLMGNAMASAIPLVAFSDNATPSFSVLGDDTKVNWDDAYIYVSLVDADSSITRLEMSCTTTYEKAKGKNYTIQGGPVTDGALNSKDAIWYKLSPGTTNWPWEIESLKGFPDWTCTFSIATGAADADIDTIEVDVRVCL